MIRPGTIAILNKGAIDSQLDAWLCLQKETYPGKIFVQRPRGNQIARQRNSAVENRFGEWLLFVDADVVPRDDVLRLLHAAMFDAGCPVVSAVVLERVPPFRVAASYINGSNEPEKIDLKRMLRSGLMPVHTIGTGCVMIRADVFERMSPPWFQCGQLDPEFLQEDTHFSLRLAEIDVTPMLLTDARCGHGTTGVIWPGLDGRRYVQWDLSNDREALVDHD